MTTTHHEAFKPIRETKIASLNITVQEFEHIKTGAQHVHLAADSPENVFLVAFRTVPENSTGVAHILEHTALCGSKKYPVRDPFFMMTRRSINTFMNAFTSSDWTAYPFASLNKKDFHNLLDVYLDATFFSRLDPLDFAQEGHRLEFAQADDPNSKLEYKGVVFNEMKGAMSSVSSQLWHTLCKYLFPTTTYHFNSGGEPECIPDLSYEELRYFYKTHYHPSNAVFMTFGDIPAADLQQKFEQKALAEFSALDHTLSVPNEKRYHAPVRVQESYPYTASEGEQNSGQKHHVVLAWLLGESTDLVSSMKAQLLAGVLLDNSASPLQHTLETSELGAAPSPLCGLDDSQKQLSFVCGLEGCSEGQADAVEKQILEKLHDIADKGIDRSEIESALHQLELHQREIGGDHYPYGLQLILNALTACIHRGEPASLLDIDATLEQLQHEIQDPNFIKNLINEYLLNNSHRIRLELSPDETLQARKEKAEEEALATIKAALSEEEKTAIVQQAQALAERQAQKDDESILPKVTLDDVTKESEDLPADKSPINKLLISRYASGTNGLVYQQLVHKMPELAEQELRDLPYYSQCVSEVGAGEWDYLDIQRRQAAVCGSFNAFSSIRTNIDNVNESSAYFTYSAKALNRHQPELSQLMSDTLKSARFDEHQRLREIITQIRSARERSITGNGHGLAMMAASAGVSPTSALSHQLSGLESIRHIKALDNSLAEHDAMRQFAQRLEALHTKIQQTEKQCLLIAEADELDTFSQNLAAHFGQQTNLSSAAFELKQDLSQVREAWLTNTQVSFCAKAYATVPGNHEDAAALSVLGGLLRNGFLHTAIREKGGAYGGGATHDVSSGAFRFYSYRDPRLEETLHDFDRAISWLLEQSLPWQKIEEAILGVISSLDKSESPAGKAKRLFHAELHGRDLAYRQGFRKNVLAVREADLKRVAECYLSPEKAHVAVVTDFKSKDLAETLGLKIEKL